jgi:hypothetical protein
LEDAEALISIPNFEVANAHWLSPTLGAFFPKLSDPPHEHPTEVAALGMKDDGLVSEAAGQDACEDEN